MINKFLIYQSEIKPSIYKLQSKHLTLVKCRLSAESNILFSIDGYNNYNQYRNDLGGSIKVFVQDNISINILNNLCYTNDIYGCLICELISFGMKYILFSIYCLPQLNINNFVIS